MSVIDIEFGKDGLEVEAKNSGLFWIVAITFVTGLALGGVIGFQMRDKGGKLAKKFKD